METVSAPQLPNLVPSEKSALRIRVLSIENQLPYNYLDIICKAYPEYDSAWGKGRIRNVRRGVVHCTKITAIFEKLVSEFAKLSDALKA